MRRRTLRWLVGLVGVLIATAAAAQSTPTPKTLSLQSDERQTAWCNFLQPVLSMSHEVFLLAGDDGDPQDLVTLTGAKGPNAIFQVDPQSEDSGNSYQIHINVALGPATPFPGTTPTPDLRDCDWKINVKDNRFPTATPTAAP